MRHLIAVVGCAALALAVPAAHAQKAPVPGWYAQGNVSLSWFENDHYTQSGSTGDLKYDNPDWGGSVAGGYKLGNGFRVEGEFGYTRADAKQVTVNSTPVSVSGNADIYTLTVNGYYDFTVAPRVTPYVGGGIGAAIVDVGTITAKSGATTVTANGHSETDFTAFGEVGIAINVAQNIDVVPSYRYLWVNDGRDGFDDDTAHIARVGARYTF